MLERVDAAFVFGSLGNLSEALGDGWSVEDNYAWAIGAESRLNLPLPGNATHYALHITLQPLVQPAILEAQRLRIESPAGVLASFSIDRRTTIELDLPIEQTRNQRRLELILYHPDAARPSEIRKSDDRRLLSLCFMSAVLSRQSDTSSADTPPQCRIVVAGGPLAREVSEAIAALPVLRNRVACHYVNTDRGPDAVPPPEDALRSAALCWEESGGNQDSAWPEWRRMLPADCTVRRFASPRITALWPFQGPDPRRVPEAVLYPTGRYPFGDRIACRLAYLQLPDDVMLLLYQSMTETEMPDLEALLDVDRASWRHLDATHDVQLADFIVENLRRYRLFFAPTIPTGEILRHVVLQLVAGSPVEALCEPAKLRRDLDFLLTGYIGRCEELPIDPRVARRLGLAWWDPGMRYRWHSNRWTFEEYALRCIKWTPWRP